jgi:hypothetical protein
VIGLSNIPPRLKLQPFGVVFLAIVVEYVTRILATILICMSGLPTNLLVAGDIERKDDVNSAPGTLTIIPEEPALCQSITPFQEPSLQLSYE